VSGLNEGRKVFNGSLTGKKKKIQFQLEIDSFEMNLISETFSSSNK
jgi:hypothetical protein